MFLAKIKGVYFSTAHPQFYLNFIAPRVFNFYNFLMLEKSDIEKYQAKLEQERRRLLAELENEQPQDFGSDVESTLDEESDESEDFSNKLAIQQALKDQLNEIDGALNRIRQGTYGICTKCGKEIEKEILELVPESELCETDKKGI